MKMWWCKMTARFTHIFFSAHARTALFFGFAATVKKIKGPSKVPRPRGPNPQPKKLATGIEALAEAQTNYLSRVRAIINHMCLPAAACYSSDKNVNVRASNASCVLCRCCEVAASRERRCAQQH